MAKMLIRKDEKGLYLITNGNKHRPGNIVGYWPSYVMNDGAVVEGKKFDGRKIPQSPLCKVQTPEGVRYWHADYEDGVWDREREYADRSFNTKITV